MNTATGAATRIGNFRTFPVARELNGQPSSTDANLLRLVGRDKRVLELGCGSGYMSDALRQQGCTVVGIEIDPQAAQIAAAICERVIVADLDYLDFQAELEADRFDVVLAGDVLEHLKDPLSVLKLLRRFLRPSGHVVISVPNVAHISIRLALLAGKFPYGQTGLLDQTHLRFFTRESFEKLLEDADLAIGAFERISNVPGDPSHFEVPFDPAIVPPSLLEGISQDPEALTYQFVVSAYPLPESGLVYIQNRIRQLAHEADAARSEAARLSIELAEALQLNGTNRVALDAAAKNLDSLRETLKSMGDHSAALAADKSMAEERMAALSEDNVALNAEVLGLRNMSREVEGSLEKARVETLALQEQFTTVTSEKVIIEARLEAATKERDIFATEIFRLREMRQESEDRSRSVQGQIRERDDQIEEQSRRANGLKAQVETLLTREKDLRDMLLEAHDQLMRRDEEIAVMLATKAPQPPAPSVVPASQTAPAAASKYLNYRQMIHKIHDAVRNHLPQGGKLLVVSKGDEDLLNIHPCKAEHFPQREDGKYAGYYPADGGSALQHLKELRHRGSQYLLIPHTALWWLDHYRELADYLNHSCTRVINDPEVCVMFDIAGTTERAVATTEIEIRLATSSQTREFGVNIAGNITSEKGVGEAARGQARSFLAAGVPITLNNVVEDTAANTVAEFADFSDANPYAVNLIHLNADALSDFLETHEQRYFEGRYNIGFWAWETSRFPDDWWDRFQYLDEIWVGSDFVLDAISSVAPIPVIKTPLAIPNRSSLSTHSRSHFGLSRKTFVFLFVFDFMSIMERKNPIGLVQAFRKAFSTRDDVTLVLKCGHSEAHPFETKMLREACKGTRITIIDSVLSRPELNSLMNAADCYVSLHRSEGFGLTMAEAMSLGKPVIATGYSGNTEYMTSANSLLVKYKRVEINKRYGPYREGEWADPDLDHAAELMRFAFKNREQAKEIGRRGRADVLRHLSPRAAGMRMRNRLLRIAQLGKISAPESEDTERQVKRNDLYISLVGRVRQVVEANLPVDSHVVVVSRGDDELLIFDDRDGAHFPQDADGQYAGYYPATDSEAIAQLEAMRSKGAEYFLLPQTAFWWLDHYSQLKSHLESNYSRVWNDPDCIIYGLRGRPKAAGSRSRAKTVARTQR